MGAVASYHSMADEIFMQKIKISVNGKGVRKALRYLRASRQDHL